MELKKLVRISMLLSISVVLGILESMIPFLSGVIPGLKIGLANIIIMYVLYTYSVKDAYLLSISRVFLVGMLRTGLFNITFLFSLVGALFSLTTMIIFKYTKLSIVGVSIIGSIFHSLGQIIVAIIILKQSAMIYYLPVLILVSIPTGIITGFIAKELIKTYKILEN